MHGTEAAACTECGFESMKPIGFRKSERILERECAHCGHRILDGAVRLELVPPTNVSPLGEHDHEIVETLALLLGCEGADLQITEATVDSLVSEYGQPASVLRGFVFPAYRWMWQTDNVQRTHFVIDAGSFRVAFDKPDRS